MVSRLRIEIIVVFPAGAGVLAGWGRGGWLRCDVMLTSFLHHPGTSQYYTDTRGRSQVNDIEQIDKNIYLKVFICFDLINFSLIESCLSW